MLVNAIYLKAAWLEPFDEALTRRCPFTTSEESSVEVDMMSEDLHRAAFASEAGWRAVRLPYIGGELALAVVVPDTGGSLGDVEASLDGPGLDLLLTGFRPVPVIRVQMPRWTFRVQAPLNDHLSALGMPTAFGEQADFAGMTAQQRLYVSHVLHEAFIPVDEAGTEAAAATAVVVRTVSAPAEPPVRDPGCDRPFLFALFDIERPPPRS